MTDKVPSPEAMKIARFYIGRHNGERMRAYRDEAETMIRDLAERLDAFRSAAVRERDEARAQLQGLILDPTLPEHLRANAHKVLGSILKVAKERDEARALLREARDAFDTLKAIQGGPRWELAARIDAALKEAP